MIMNRIALLLLLLIGAFSMRAQTTETTGKEIVFVNEFKGSGNLEGIYHRRHPQQHNRRIDRR